MSWCCKELHRPPTLKDNLQATTSNTSFSLTHRNPPLLHPPLNLHFYRYCCCCSGFRSVYWDVSVVVANAPVTIWLCTADVHQNLWCKIVSRCPTVVVESWLKSKHIILWTCKLSTNIACWWTRNRRIWRSTAHLFVHATSVLMMPKNPRALEDYRPHSYHSIPQGMKNTVFHVRTIVFIYVIAWQRRNPMVKALGCNVIKIQFLWRHTEENT